MKEPDIFVYIQDKLKENWKDEEILKDANLKLWLTVCPSPLGTKWLWLSYACLKWNVKTRRRDSLMSPGFVLWRQYFDSSGACRWLVEHDVISLTFSILESTDFFNHYFTWDWNFLLKLQDSIERWTQTADWYLSISDLYLQGIVTFWKYTYLFSCQELD